MPDPSPDAHASPETPAGRLRAVPVPVLVAACLVGVEGLVLLGLGTLEALSLTSGRLTMGLTTTAFFVAGGAGLLACAWGLLRLARATRGPAMMAQLICLGMAWSLRGGGTTPVALALLAVATVTIVALLHPRTTEALEDDAGEG